MFHLTCRSSSFTAWTEVNLEHLAQFSFGYLSRGFSVDVKIPGGQPVWSDERVILQIVGPQHDINQGPVLQGQRIPTPSCEAAPGSGDVELNGGDFERRLCESLWRRTAS